MTPKKNPIEVTKVSTDSANFIFQNAILYLPDNEIYIPLKKNTDFKTTLYEVRWHGISITNNYVS